MFVRVIYKSVWRYENIYNNIPIFFIFDGFMYKESRTIH